MLGDLTMDEPTLDTNRDLEYLYKEYVRINNRLDSIVDSSFDDFKLLSSIGVLVAWPPIAKSNLFNEPDSAFLLLIGFLGILFIIIILALRDLIKQSLMEYYLHELQTYEAEIRANLKSADLNSFKMAKNWLERRQGAWGGVVSRFNFMFYLFLFFFPIGILVRQGAFLYAVVYGATELISLGIYLNAVKLLYRHQ